MRIAFVGCVDFSKAALCQVLTLPDVELCGVVTRAASPGNADFVSLEDVARSKGLPVLLADRADRAAQVDFLRACEPDVLYCFGWSSILERVVLEIPPLGAIGFHPAALPYNRGRHPIVWALALGLEATASTFFFMDEQPDHGAIVSQREIEISDEDDAASLYAKIQATALQQIPEFTGALMAGSLQARPQEHARANSWRKRGYPDGQIDWRMSSRSIYNLVRALTRPYVGAHCVVGGSPVKVWRASLGPSVRRNLEPGKVLEVADETILVKTGDGSVRLVEHELDPVPAEGAYL